VATRSLSLLLPIVAAFPLTNVAALVQSSLLDMVSAFRRMSATTPIPKMPAPWRIPRYASHFRVVFVTNSLWHWHCSFAGWALLKQTPRRYAIMESFRAGQIEKAPDHALVTAAKRGDTYAFEKLVLRHRRRVLAVALRVMKNREDAEDVVQESFQKAFLHLDRFQEAAQFSTWLTRIALNESYMVLRRRRRVPEVLPVTSDDGASYVPEAFVDQRPNPEESCWRREHFELLTKAINRLGPTIRKTIWLRMVEERSVEETAQLLDTSVAAVKSRVCRGRRELSGIVNRALVYASPA
jgi:RNA polymerase sigma-70 factor (ECF subfamily)